jgi:hypothetical protein
MYFDKNKVEARSADLIKMDVRGYVLFFSDSALFTG